MKLDKKFIRIYDVMFAWVLKNNGLDGLISFWKHIAPYMLNDLQSMAKKDGVDGCYNYWNDVLKAEKAKFKLKLSKDKKSLELEITECPAIRTLSSPKCSEYCRHCGVMYPEVLEPLGLKYTWKRKGTGRCEIKVEEV